MKRQSRRAKRAAGDDTARSSDRPERSDRQPKSLKRTELRDLSSDSPTANPEASWVNNNAYQLERDDERMEHQEALGFDCPDHFKAKLQDKVYERMWREVNHKDHRLEAWRSPDRFTSVILGRPVQVLLSRYLSVSSP